MAEPMVLTKERALLSVHEARWTNAVVRRTLPETEYALCWRQTVVIDARIAGCTLREIAKAIGLTPERVRGIAGAMGRIKRRKIYAAAKVPMPKKARYVSPPRVSYPLAPTLAEYRAQVLAKRRPN